MTKLETLWSKQGGKCFYCDCETYLRTKEPKLVARIRFGIKMGSPKSSKRLRYRQATIEHLVRLCDNGSWAWSNLVMACAYCNNYRADASVGDHRTEMRRRAIIQDHPNWRAS